MSENNSWEPEDNCANVCKAIANFYHKYPQAPRWIAQMQFDGLCKGNLTIKHNAQILARGIQRENSEDSPSEGGLHKEQSA